MNHVALSARELEDLDALFDSVVMKSKVGKAYAEATPSGNSSDTLINRIGRLTRALHDSLQELGYDKSLQRSTAIIPNAFDRLHYVASMTNQAAEDVLAATEAAQPVIEQIEIDAQRLAREWEKLFDNKLDAGQFKFLAGQTRDFLAALPGQTKAANSCLMEIKTAQGSQDRAGQVIQQVVDVTQRLEKQLLELLIANPPSSADPIKYAELLSRPATGPDRRSDAASSRDHVDELLECLGF